MNILQDVFIQTLCLKHGVSHEKLTNLAGEYCDMFTEVLQNNTTVNDTLSRRFDLEHNTVEEIQLLYRILTKLFCLPIQATQEDNTIIFWTDLKTYPIDGL